MTKEEMRDRLKEAGKKGYMIYALCDELREEAEAKDREIKELKHTVAGLQNKCETCECAKFADETIKPSKMLMLWGKLNAN